MKHYWLNKKNNKELIVFFNGWGMNETPISHLDYEKFDVLMIYDYQRFDFDFSQFGFEKYEKKYLICWSMGVYVVNLFSEIFNNFDKKIAINGTNKVIDDDFGILKKIYKVTVKFLNEDSCEKFIKNMFDNGKINPNITITKDIKELKNELIAIQNIELNKELNFDLAIVSNNDRIIPTKNQLNFWKEKNIKIKTIEATHCIFENYKSWSELLWLN